MNWAKRSKRTLLLVLISAVMLAAGGTALAGGQSYSALDEGDLFKKGTHYTESIDMMFDVMEGGALSLGTTNGSVRVKTWSRNQVRLVITKTTSASSPYNARTILEDFLVQARHEGGDLDLKAVPAQDTAGAVREVAGLGDVTVAALAPVSAGEAHGLVVLLTDVLDRSHNTTRFVVVAPGEPEVDPGDDKTTVVFTTSHRPGALALVLTELGLRGANLTRIESRPAAEAWSYRFFVDLVHED